MLGLNAKLSESETKVTELEKSVAEYESKLKDAQQENMKVPNSIFSETGRIVKTKFFQSFIHYLFFIM